MEQGTTRRTRVFCPDIDGQTATLSAEEAHHLTHVRRLRAGDEVVVFDGRGGQWRATISREAVAVQLTLGAPVPAAAEPPVAVRLAVGLLKGDALADVVRDATMLGVAAVVPFVSAHTALSAAARRTRDSGRWTRIAVASAKQCGRAVVPRIEPVSTLTDILNAGEGPLGICLEPSALWDGAPELTTPPPAITVLVGPEGGWSAQELADVRTAGAGMVSLGPRTLRAEIAPVVALASLWTRWGWT